VDDEEIENGFGRESDGRLSELRHGVVGAEEFGIWMGLVRGRRVVGDGELDDDLSRSRAVSFEVDLSLVESSERRMMPRVGVAGFRVRESG